MHVNPNIAVGERIREFRLKLGLSQEVLAEKCGLHRTYVGGVERGERNITLITLQKFASALGVSIETLLASHDLPE